MKSNKNKNGLQQLKCCNPFEIEAVRFFKDRVLHFFQTCIQTNFLSFYSRKLCGHITQSDI